MANEKSFAGDAFARAAVEFSRLAAPQDPKAKTHATRAIALLQKAKAAGYFGDSAAIAWLNWEPLFNPLRKDEEFQQLVKGLAKQPKK